MCTHMHACFCVCVDTCGAVMCKCVWVQIKLLSFLDAFSKYIYINADMCFNVNFEYIYIYRERERERERERDQVSLSF